MIGKVDCAIKHPVNGCFNLYGLSSVATVPDLINVCTGILIMVNINQYPQLKLIAWHLPQVTQLEEQEAFALYERNWRFIDEQTVTETEKQFIQMLTKEYGGGLLNV